MIPIHAHPFSSLRTLSPRSACQKCAERPVGIITEKLCESPKTIGGRHNIERDEYIRAVVLVKFTHRVVAHRAGGQAGSVRPTLPDTRPHLCCLGMCFLK